MEALPEWEVTEISEDGQSSVGSSNLMELDEEMSLLAQLSERLQLHGNELVFGIDTKGCVNAWNRKAVELTNLDKEDMVGQPFVDMFITTDVQEPLQNVLDKAYMGEETTDFAFPFYSLDARCIQVLLTTVTHRNEVGEIVGTFCVGKYMTELEMDSLIA
jgi:PAS domain-containing protein